MLRKLHLLSVTKSTLVLSITLAFATAHADIFDEIDDESFDIDTTGENLSADGTFNDSELEKEFQAWKEAEEKEYQAWKEQYLAELEAYKNKIRDVWDTAEVTDKKTWVEYSPDLKTKKVIDYENNEIRISVQGEDETPSQERVQAYLEEILSTTPNTARANDPVLQATGQSAPSADPKSSASMLAEIVTDAAPSRTRTPPSNKASSDTAKRATKTIADAPVPNSKPEPKPSPKPTPNNTTPEKAKPKPETKSVASTKRNSPPQIKKVAAALSASARVSTQSSSKKKKTTTITVKLPNDASFKRSSQYQKQVLSRASQYKLDPSLVFAIMHTESAFNPMARSPIPAFGLMQIVPSSAGKDVTQNWNGSATLLKPNELFNAELNIHAGSTYLHILYYRYLKRISDPVSRTYCVIAAYNTGAGNVSEAFIGSKRIKNAFPVINKLSPQQVYDTLLAKLPYDETRHYLERVTARQKVYKSLL